MCSYSELLLLVAQMLGSLNPIRLLSYWLKVTVRGNYSGCRLLCWEKQPVVDRSAV